MKFVLFSFIICLLLGCQDEYHLRTVTKENISFINANRNHLNEIILLSQEVYNRSKNKTIDISIFQENTEVSAHQEITDASATYCISHNWNTKQITTDPKWKDTLAADSISLSKIQKKMLDISTGRIDIENNKLSFNLSGFYSSDLLFDLNVSVSKVKKFDIPSTLGMYERPCTIYIGNGFSIYCSGLEHGITKKFQSTTPVISRTSVMNNMTMPNKNEIVSLAKDSF